MGKSLVSLNSRELFQGLNVVGEVCGMVDEFFKYALCSLGVFEPKVKRHRAHRVAELLREG